MVHGDSSGAGRSGLHVLIHHHMAERREYPDRKRMNFVFFAILESIDLKCNAMHVLMNINAEKATEVVCQISQKLFSLLIQWFQ